MEVKINFTTPVTIPATTNYFGVFGSVSGVTSSQPGSSMLSGFSLLNISNFSWTDIAGYNSVPFTSANATFYYNYPTYVTTILN